MVEALVHVWKNPHPNRSNSAWVRHRHWRSTRWFTNCAWGKKNKKLWDMNRRVTINSFFYFIYLKKQKKKQKDFVEIQHPSETGIRHHNSKNKPKKQEPTSRMFLHSWGHDWAVRYEAHGTKRPIFVLQAAQCTSIIISASLVTAWSV